MNRTTMRRTATATISLLLAGAAALGVSGQAMAATAPATASHSSSSSSATTVDTGLRIDSLPAHQIGTDHRPYEFTVRYADDTRLAQAQQILVLSPEHGPYLQSDDIRLEWFDDATRRWEPMDLDSQTGTLYTRIPLTGRILTHDGDTAIRYRITVQRDLPTAPRHLTVQPRTILYTAPQTTGTQA
ncbi:hypothetical protein ACFU7Y_31640 [Kitasatospora sp. NPDC057542]|uniref:hypothetical protein n=1 Tax=Streptomycetaceae TaxID=2062 RepID=UPI001CCFFBA1|nr:hypothetical protein [Streptomyces sp. LS1784]